MLHYLLQGSEEGQHLLVWIEYFAVAIEIVAVLIIVVAIFLSLARYFWRTVVGSEVDEDDHYGQLKVNLGKTLLLGLEILVAADIVRTVALEATFESVLVLGMLVVIRTFLSWALVVEIEGRWPWRLGGEG